MIQLITCVGDELLFQQSAHWYTQAHTWVAMWCWYKQGLKMMRSQNACVDREGLVFKLNHSGMEVTCVTVKEKSTLQSKPSKLSDLHSVKICFLNANHSVWGCKQHVVTLPCCSLSVLQGNKGKTGVIIAAYMHYSKISAGWVCVSETSQSHSSTFSSYTLMEHIKN